MPRVIDTASDLYPVLIATNEAAFQAGRYETAYHALMAALHSAEDFQDSTRLEEVASLAESQQSIVDAATPQHRLSSGYAAGHGHKGVFVIAASQARTRANLIRRQASEPSR